MSMDLDMFDACGPHPGALRELSATVDAVRLLVAAVDDLLLMQDPGKHEPVLAIAALKAADELIFKVRD